MLTALAIGMALAWIGLGLYFIRQVCRAPRRQDWESSADERYRGYTVGPFTAPVGKEPGDLTPQQALQALGRPVSDERPYGAERRPR